MLMFNWLPDYTLRLSISVIITKVVLGNTDLFIFVYNYLQMCLHQNKQTLSSITLQYNSFKCLKT